MTPQILPVSERGQITIPKEMRDNIKVKFFVCEMEDDTLILKPLQTREEFIEELEEAEKDCKKHGGKTLAQMRKKYNL
ncbi:AbrB/MazE/SpoVT family DNA-binding domain-containing protein [Candidatus Peregrinibacteria bacterium]|nr:AbrB/MazE/SpoVT family DNA-binding domain-containing protein [Candidatus Peregrinibacteria bacterium]